MPSMTATVASMDAQPPAETQSPVVDTPRNVLNEYRPGLEFNVIQSATPGSNVTVLTELDGHEFHGVGSDFETATQRAALEVITYLYSTEEIAFGIEKYNTLMAWKPQANTNAIADPLSKVLNSANASPLMIFNQLFQKENPEWTVQQLSVVPSKFEAVLKFSEKMYTGIDSTKKLARQKAAEAALDDMNVTVPASLQTPTSAKKRRLEDVAARGSTPKLVSADGDVIHTPTPPKRKRKQAEGGTPVFPESKNPLQILNEFRRGIVFETISQQGPSHAPTITMACELDGQRFEAVSSSKQKAKLKLGQDVVNHFRDLGLLILSPSTPATDSSETPSSASKAPQVISSGGQKTPLMMLYELAKCQLPCEVQEYEENKTKRFVAKFTLDEKVFEGEGLSKQRAKHRAAEIILRDVYGVHAGSQGTNGDWNITGFGEGGSPSDIRMLQFADRVRRSVMEKWRSLCETKLTEENGKRKVIAGIVMTRDSKSAAMEAEEHEDKPPTEDLPELFSHEELLCVTTGTKCLGGEFITAQGTVLNDCHAEVLSARCLRYILYNNIELILKGGESVILERRTGDQRFSLRPGVQLHLYISTAPCGDARIFCPHELGDLTGDSHPGRRSRGLLRTKIESGEGTIPVVGNGSGLQTFDAVIQGERLLTMSCSDKLCLWNVLGMQGSLLSRLLTTPVYFNTIIVGSVFVESHLERALYGRACNMPYSIPDPFKVTRPNFLVTTERDERQARKSPGISVVWIADGDDEALEVVIAARGKVEGDKPSRLSKQALFSRFCKIEEQLPWMMNGKDACIGAGSLGEPHEKELYAEAKQVAKPYQETKRQLHQHFKTSGLGSWIRRPMEQDLFELVE